MNNKILIEPIDPKRQNSFWYNEESVIAYYNKNDRYIKVKVEGEIIILFPDEQDESGYKKLKNAQASDYAFFHTYTLLTNIKVSY